VEEPESQFSPSAEGGEGSIMLNLSQAKQKRNRDGCIGWTLVLTSSAEILLGLFVNFYLCAIDPHGLGLFRVLAVNLMRLIWTVPGMPFLLEHAPAPNFVHFIDYSNLYPLFWCGVWLVGSQLIFSARHLSQTIANASQQAQEYKLKEEMLGPESTMATAVAYSLEMHPRIQLSYQKIQLAREDKWYSRPQGVLGLTIIGGVIYTLLAQAIMLKFGWIH
jgi:hypothetical protein